VELVRGEKRGVTRSPYHTIDCAIGRPVNLVPHLEENVHPDPLKITSLVLINIFMCFIFVNDSIGFPLLTMPRCFHKYSINYESDYSMLNISCSRHSPPIRRSLSWKDSLTLSLLLYFEGGRTPSVMQGNFLRFMSLVADPCFLLFEEEYNWLNC
jgi:hypothetical protein